MVKWLGPFFGVVLAFLSLFALGFLDNIRGPFFPEVSENFDLNDTQASWFYGLTSGLAFLTSLWARSLLKTQSALRLLRWGLVFMGLGSMGTGLAATKFELFLSAAVFGLGFGFVTVAQNVLINQYPNESVRRRLFSGLHTFYGLSSLLSPLFASIIFSFELHWRLAFLWGATVPLLVVLLSFLRIRERSSASIENPTGSGFGREGSQDLPPSPVEGFRLSDLKFPIAISLYIAGEIALSSRIPLFVRREFLWGPASASQLLTGFFVALTLGRLSFFIFSFSNLSSHFVLQVALVGSISSTLLGLFVNPLFLVLSGLFMAPIFPMALQRINEIYGQRSDELIAVLVAFGSLSVFFAHLGLGQLTGELGILNALALVPILLFLSLLGIQDAKANLPEIKK